MKHLIFGLAWLAYAAAPALAQSPDTLRFAHYNLLKYADPGCQSLTIKNARLKTIFDALRPDILSVNEMLPSVTAINSLLTNALTFNAHLQSTTFGNSSGSEIVNTLYYNTDKLGYLGHQAITGNIRDIDIYRLYHLATTHPGDTSDLYCFVAHFKSSQGVSNVNARAAAAQSVVNWLQAHPQIQRYTLSGDFNLYSSTEPAYQTLLQRFDDPTGQTNGWQGPGFAALQTQSPADGTEPCSVTGGMDDRFDFILSSADLLSGNGRIVALPYTYQTFGNDGVSYNSFLQCDATTSVSASVCAALRTASDHLPVTMQLLMQGTTPVVQVWDPRRQCRILGNPVTENVLIRLPEERSSLASWKIL
ncbi:MAG: hypothetical protein ABIQ93_13405, partial [Saprospiraceae bacterium]